MELLKEWVYKDSICAITEHDLFHTFNGYASVTADHPLYEKDYNDLPEEFYDIHGGITFSGAELFCPLKSKGGLWWFGFDFAHAGDMDFFPRFSGYRNNVKIEEVIKEAEKLANILFLYKEKIKV
jgi:hypothetical protein